MTQLGSITAKGYRRIRLKNRKQKLEHVMVWEKVHGKIPPGMHVHHKDHDKLNNSISNLELLTPLEHKRKHSGCELRSGEWWKPCTKCKEMKKVETDFYQVRTRKCILSICKKCQIKNSVENKKKRR